MKQRQQKGIKKNKKRALFVPSTKTTLAPVTEEDEVIAPTITSLPASGGPQSSSPVVLPEVNPPAGQLRVASRPPLQHIAPNQSTTSTQSAHKKHTHASDHDKKNNNSVTEATQPEEKQQQDNTQEKTDIIQLVTTTQHMLELVLSEVVEIVVDAERNQHSTLDVDRLQQLLQFPDMSSSVKSPHEDTLCVSRAELQQIVMRVVVAAKESVRRGTPKPAGISMTVVSNVEQKNAPTVHLSWLNRWETNNSTTLPSGPNHHPPVFGERVCI